MTTTDFDLHRALTDVVYRAGLSPTQRACLPRVLNGDELKTRGEFDPLGLPPGVEAPIATDTGLVPMDSSEVLVGELTYDDPTPAVDTDAIYIGC